MPFLVETILIFVNSILMVTSRAIVFEVAREQQSHHSHNLLNICGIDEEETLTSGDYEDDDSEAVIKDHYFEFLLLVRIIQMRVRRNGWTIL